MLHIRLASILALTLGSAFLATACTGASDDEHTGVAAQRDTDPCPANWTLYGESVGGFCCDGTEDGGYCDGTICALDPTRTQGFVLCPSVMPECRAGWTRYGEWAGGFCCDGTEDGGYCDGTICALDPTRTQGFPLCPVCPPLWTLYGEWAGGFCCDGTEDGGYCDGTICALDSTRTQGFPLCPSVM